MPITERQREQRRKHIGSSDAAALLGVDPYKTAYDVWLEKTGRVDGPEETPAMLIGTMMENGILDWASRDLGPLVRNQRRVYSKAPIAANIDALRKTVGEPVEAKVSSDEDWGTEGTDQVPERIIPQCMVHMLCASADVCHVAAYLPIRRSLRLYVVHSDVTIMDLIAERATEMMDVFVKTDTPPPSVPSLDLIRKARRSTGTVEIAPDVAAAYLEIKRAAADAEAELKAAQAEFLALFGDADAADCGPVGMFTFKEVTQKRFDLDRFRADHPDLAAEYLSANTSRRLSHKKPKKELTHE